VRETPYQGPERRRFDRTPPPAPRVIGRARIGEGFPRTVTAPLPRGQWFPVVDRNPATIPETPLAGHVWIDSGGHLILVWAAFLEVELDCEG
jgi:hypothetical protein